MNNCRRVSTSAPNIEVNDCISNAAPLSFLIDAVEKLLADKSFGPPSHLAVTAQHTENNLLKWLKEPENKQEAKYFSNSIFTMLSKFFDVNLPTRVCEERMWGTFHQLQCSQSYSGMWSTFLMRTLSVDACPIFYQYITDTFFRLMIKEQLQLTKEESCSGEQTTQ